jgi:serine/threonine-protein kinase
VATPLPGTEQVQHVFFSPDGSRVGFAITSQRVLVASLAGGPPVTIADSGVGLDGATWSADGYVYYDGFTGGTAAGLARVPAAGGQAELVTTVDTASGESDHIWPVALPDGRGILFMVARGGDVRTSDIAVVDPVDGAHRVLVRGVAALYAGSGHLIYLTADGTLMAALFDTKRLEMTGDAVALAGGVGVHSFGSADLAVSATGTLAYVTGSQQAEPSEIVWVTPGAPVEPVDPGWVGDFRTLALSPDGRRLAVSIFQNGEQQVWVKELPRGPLTKLTFDGVLNYRPQWTADGRNITYISNTGTEGLLMSKRADGSAAADTLLDLENVDGRSHPVRGARTRTLSRWPVDRLPVRRVRSL